MLSDQSNQAEASVEPIESAGVEEVAPIPIPEYVNELVRRAKGAAGQLATLSTAVKNRALLAMAEALEAQKDALLAANELDLEAFGTAPEKRAMGFTMQAILKRVPRTVAPLIGGTMIASLGILAGMRTGLAITIRVCQMAVCAHSSHNSSVAARSGRVERSQ